MNNRSKALNYLLYFFLAFFIILFFPPFFYHHPEPGTDPSWDIAINLAFKYHLQFGKDILFTYGPLAVLHDRLPIVVNKYGYLAFDIYLLATAFFVMKEILKKHFNAPVLIFIFIVLIISMYGSPDQWCYFFFLYYIFSFLKYPAKAVSVIQAALLSLICFYYKSNLGMVAISIFLVAVLFGLLRKKINILSFVIILVVFFISIWLSAKAFNVNLGGYIRGGTHIINAYNDAMFIPNATELFTWAAVLIMIVIICWAAWWFISSFRKKELFKQPDEIFIYCITGFSAFILFKSGFVRGDSGHLYVFYKGIAMCVALLFLFNPPNFSSKMAAIGCWIVLIICGASVNFMPGSYGPLTRVANLSFISFRAGELKEYFQGFKEYDNALAESNKLTTSDNEYRRVIGDKTTDIVPVEVSTIYFKGLHYCPRPIMQSYSTYDAYLDSLNYEKYASPGGPEYVLFTVSAIDNRVPFFDESKTKLALLTNYSVAGRIGPDLLLKRREKIRGLTPSTETTTTFASMGEDIPIPNSDDIVVSKIFVDYNLWGKMQRLFYQPPALQITFTLDNNDTRTFRAIQPILAGGVIINKYVESDPEFQLFMQADGRLNASVKKIRIEPARKVGGFAGKIKLVTTSYKLGKKTEADRIADSIGVANLSREFDQYVPTPLTKEYKTDSLSMWVDNFKTHSALIEADGWAYRKNGDNAKSKITLILKSATNTFEIPTQQMTRVDLMVVFNRKDVLNMGFKAAVSKRLLPKGSYELGVMVTENGQQYVSFNTHHQVLIKSDYTLEKIDSTALLPAAANTLSYNIESVEDKKEDVLVTGWAVAEKANPVAGVTHLLLKSKGQIYRVNVDVVKREDVGMRYKNPLFANAGFTVSIAKDKLPVGVYTIGIEKLDTITKEHTVIFSDKTIKAGISDLFIPAVIITALPPGQDFKTSIDVFQENDDDFTISGWAVQNMMNVQNSTIAIILKGDKTNYSSATESQVRKDVTAAFKNQGNLDDCGFSAKISKKGMSKGKYEIGIYVYQQDNKGTVKFLNRFITVR